MEGFKITQEALSGKGVVGLADSPRLTTAQMQQKFDEIATDVLVPKHNALVDKLAADFATKTDVSNAVFESRSSDMTKAVYDRDSDGVVDDAEKLGGQPASYYAAAENAISGYESVLQSYAVLPAGTTVYMDLEDLTDVQTTAAETLALIRGSTTMSDTDYTLISYGGAEAAVLSSAFTATNRFHALSGSGDNIKFTAAADFLEGDGFKLNGQDATAETADGEALSEGCFKSGAVVSCFKGEANKLNFKSGGSVLDVQVKAYATEAALLADTPGDNTIGVVTAAAISEWVFSATRPATRLDGSALSGGELWIFYDSGNAASVNVLKKNALYANTKYCMQYTSGAWSQRKAYTRRNGQWVDWNYYLYNNGEGLLSGTNAWVEGGIHSDPEITVGNTYVELWMGGNSVNSGMRSNIAVDLTDYSSLKATVSIIYVYSDYGADLDKWRFGVTNNSNLGANYLYIGNYSTLPGTAVIGATQTFTYNVSSFNGSYYVYAMVPPWCRMRVLMVWLEA